MDEILRQVFPTRRAARFGPQRTAREDAAWAESLEWQTNEYAFHSLFSGPIRNSSDSASLKSTTFIACNGDIFLNQPRQPFFLLWRLLPVAVGRFLRSIDALLLARTPHHSLLATLNRGGFQTGGIGRFSRRWRQSVPVPRLPIGYRLPRARSSLGPTLDSGGIVGCCPTRSGVVWPGFDAISQ